MENIKGCRITDDYVFFWGSEFSNWSPSIFWYAGQRFHNSEQAFMWEKASFFGDDKMRDEIQKETNPKYVKALGRKVKGYDDTAWTIHSFGFMFSVNFAKYKQSEILKELLLSTGDRTLVEASPYDRIWGIGIGKDDDDCLDENKWKGMNLLGKALMQVRKQLKEEENEEDN